MFNCNWVWGLFGWRIIRILLNYRIYRSLQPCTSYSRNLLLPTHIPKCVGMLLLCGASRSDIGAFWVLTWFSSVVRKTAGYKTRRRRLSSYCHGWLQEILSLPQIQWPSIFAPRASQHPSHHSFPSEELSVRKDFQPSAAMAFIINTSLLSPKTPNLLGGSRFSLIFKFQQCVTYVGVNFALNIQLF